jgi:hypothetical protein
MATPDFTITFLVDQSPEEAFNAINNVRGWWSESLEGDSEKLNDEFTYRYKDIHYSRQRLIEVIPNKKVVWLVLDSNLYFVDNQTEWTGTKIIFEVIEKNQQTEVQFTHQGLIPEFECYDACSKGWTYFISGSLYNLITTGKGQPNILDHKIEQKAETLN